MARRQATQIDPDAIPAFLIRTRTDETRRRADLVVKSILSRDRDWVMPDRNRVDKPSSGLSVKIQSTLEREEEKAMAKRTGEEAPQQEIKTQDPALPVKMEFAPEKGARVVKDFPDLQEFMDWFDPSIHEVTGSDADSALTMITVREKPGKVTKAKANGDPELAGANAVAGPIPPTGRKGVGRGSVIKAADTESKSGRGGARPGMIRHSCKVDGKEQYGSVYQAFLDLRLDVGKHTKFRSDLKAAPGLKLVYEETGKKYSFELVEIKK